MTEAVKTVFLDVYSRNRMIRVWVKQYDGGARFLRVVLLSGGTQIPASPSDTALLNVIRPDGQNKTFLCTINEDGSVKAPIPRWAAEIPGSVFGSITVIGAANDRTTTLDMMIQVEEGSASVDPGTDENYDVLVGLISECSDIKASYMAAMAELQNKLNGSLLSVSEEMWSGDTAVVSIPGLSSGSLVILVPNDEITRAIVSKAGVYVPADSGSVSSVDEIGGTITLKRKSGIDMPPSLYFRVFRIECGQGDTGYGAGVFMAGSGTGAVDLSELKGTVTGTATVSTTAASTGSVTGLLTDAFMDDLAYLFSLVPFKDTSLVSTKLTEMRNIVRASRQVSVSGTVNVSAPVTGSVRFGTEEDPDPTPIIVTARVSGNVIVTNADSAAVSGESIILRRNNA